MFRAYESGRDRLVAIKVFRLDLTPEQAASLVRELDRLARLAISHPHIAAPIAAGLESGAAYLAQEYAVGDSLDIVLRERGPLPVPEGVALAESLASAIDALAARGVHHGSLHLRDIILSADGVRATGFGIAAALKAVGAKLPTRPPYSSPGNLQDLSSDIYSLGAIAFEAMSGRRPSEDNLAGFDADHGSAIKDLFIRALAEDPHLRPSSAAAFAAALREAAKIEPLEPAEVSEPAEIELGSTELDRFTDVDVPPAPASSDPPVEPFPPSWSAQPPKAFQAQEPVALPQERRWKGTALVLALILFGVMTIGYVLGSRQEAPEAGDPAVDATTVDLASTPPAVSTAPASPAATPSPAAAEPDRAASPPASTLPAPTPSRPASGAAAAPKAPVRGSVLVRSTPANADVLVNGQARGKTPLSVRDLPLGSYTIRVARDGYVPEDRTLRLTARQPAASASFALQETAPRASGVGGVNVVSRPPGARVFVNDRLMGSTPLALPGLPAGPATVRIELDGYQTWTTTVLVNAGGSTRVAASLDRR